MKSNTKVGPPVSNTGTKLRKSQTKYLYLIDWLSFSCFTDFSFLKQTNIKQSKGSTAIFNYIHTLYVGSVEYITIFSSPKSKILPPDFCIIKLCNSVLYDSDYFDIFDVIITKYGFSRITINRIDLCIDFQVFEHNRKPQNFIKSVLSEDIIKKGNGKLNTIASYSDKLNFEYLRFGSRSSFVSSYLYFKSKEFVDKSKKEHIINTWKNAEFTDLNNVWRLEFSINTKQANIFDKESAELLNFTIDNVKDKTFIINAIKYLCSKYYVFYFNSRRVRKSDNDIVKLFDFELFQSLRISKNVHFTDATKYNKQILNLMIDNFREFKGSENHSVEQFKTFMFDYAFQYNLIDHLNKKLNDCRYGYVSLTTTDQ